MSFKKWWLSSPFLSLSLQLREVILRSLQLAQLVSLPPGGRVCYGFPRVRGECVSEEGAVPEPSNSSGGTGRNQAGGFPRGVHDFTNHCSFCLKQNANEAKHVPKDPSAMVSPGARGQTTVTNGWWREGHRR